MYNVFFSTGYHFVAGLSARSYEDRSCISRRTMMYCELWGGVRMSNHCDVTFTEWGPPLPLILSIIAFDECTGWLSFNWCISLICMCDLIGYLIGVTIFAKKHIHCCSTDDSISDQDLIHAVKCTRIYFYVHYSHFNKHNVIIHWEKLMLILMGTNDAPLISIYFDWIWFHVKMYVISNGSWNNKEREKWQSYHILLPITLYML